MNASDPVLFAPRASLAFGGAVAARLGVALAPLEEREYPDGEHKARPLESVRGRDAYVIQSLHADAGGSVNDKLCRLLFIVGTLRDAGATRVTAVVPYLAYARKDFRAQARDPVTTRYVATLLEAVGTDCVVTLDVHNLAAFQNAFRCRAENLEAAGLLVAHVAPLLGEAPVAVVSPDAGGIKRAERFRARLAAALERTVTAAFAEKHRSGEVLTGDALVGDVKGRVAIIVDDLVGTGGTLDRAAHACLRNGAARVFAVATHGLFAGEANAILAASPIERIVVTDTVPGFRIVDPALAARVDFVPTAGLFAQAIHCLHADGSLVALRES